MCCCACWHRQRPAGRESEAGRPAASGKWLGGAVAWRLTGGQTVGGDDHTLRTIITHGGGHRQQLVQQWLSHCFTPLRPLFQQLHDQQFFVFINLVKAFKTCYVRPFLTLSSYTNIFCQLWKILIMLIRAFCVCFAVSAYRWKVAGLFKEKAMRLTSVIRIL